jgi:hypothetical protein
MPTPKMLIVVSSVPFVWEGINLVPVTLRDTTGDGCGCDTWSKDPKNGSNYRLAMVLTLAVYSCISCANWCKWMEHYTTYVILTSYLLTKTESEIRRVGKKGKVS